MGIKITESSIISNYGKPYIIAEIGANHNGDMILAKKMIEIAANAGADCVKFQSWSVNSVFSKKVYEDNYFLNDDYRDREDTNLKDIVEKFSISEEQLLEMKKYCDELNIDCMSTPFSKEEVDFLIDDLEASFIKVASMDLNNYPLLKYFAQKKVPLIISTGLNELYEIDKAIKTIEETGNTNIIILHCVSIYPPENYEVNLKRITTLQQMYPDYPIGFSDHSLGSALPIASVALGACIIEKHIILDRSHPTADAPFSLTGEEFNMLVKSARAVREAIGNASMAFGKSSAEKTSKKWRRSIFVVKNIKKGEPFVKGENVRSIRPADGLHTRHWDLVLGSTAACDIKEGTPLSLPMLKLEVDVDLK